MKKENCTTSRLVIALLLSFLAVQGWAANTKKTVTQVTDTVTVTENWDYIINSDTPFGDVGVVNIVNTDNAVIILNKVKPSAALKLLAKHVQINGTKAVNNTNCQVKIYNLGCIILPYGNSVKPLVCFTEKNFEGDSCNTYGLGNSSGYMNTLSAKLLNNKIRSFKLKRGYMVTFSLKSGGRGYSRCFIAADKDLEVKELPVVMDQKISSYRVFKWYDCGKKQLANDLTRTTLAALNVQSSYTWSQGESMAPDYECIPNHIYEDYPSSSAIGAATWSPHTKTNNEPKNTSDDHPQDLTTILNNWENMMRTGMRLCSPASWDGSDYWNATGFLADFMDSIDARGWRCDIIDLHCYWAEGSFGNIHYWSDKYKRPIWISEWCWGASWNNNGAFASGVTETDVKNALQRICTSLNGYNYVERYYYWNGERDPSKLYKNGSLTPAGEYYASMNSGVGYNGKYDFVPTTPRQYAPSKYKETTDVNGKVTKLAWYDSNGEFNQLMEVQKKTLSGLWQTLAVIDQKEDASNYTYTIPAGDEALAYRLHVIDLNGNEYYTNDALGVGDAIQVDGKELYVGGNLLPNGDFDLGFTGWTCGTGTELSEPQFQVVGDGGYHGGAYLQAHTNGSVTSTKGVRTLVDLVAGQNYVFRAASVNSGSNMKVALSTDGSAMNKQVAKLTSTDSWKLETFTFNSETYTKAIIGFYTLGAKAQADAVALHQLFDTREAAIADGVEKARLRAEAQKQYNKNYAFLNDDLTNKMAAVTGTDEAALGQAERLLAEHMEAVAAMPSLDVAAATLKAIEERPCPYYTQIKYALNEAQTAQTSEGLLKSASNLSNLMDTYVAFTRSTKQPRYGSFANAKTDGWEVKVGTFTGGDQKATTQFGKTCWNAWWSTTNSTATMEIRQTVTGLPEGYYLLDCQATTQHFCISDQHGYLTCGDQTVVTPTLSKDYFDLPVSNVWETLSTTPVYVPADGTVTLGFVGSKKGAKTGYWHAFGETSNGDNREGWWCATGFVLKYHAIDDLTGIDAPRVFTEQADGTYTLDGRRMQEGTLRPGIYIKVIGGRPCKTIVK